MGLALPAELNGYPGPSHVLELADKLSLSAQQTGQMQRLFDSMKAEAVVIGAKLIRKPPWTINQFSGRTITAESLKTATAQIGATQADLRNTHLKDHVQTVQILTPQQVQEYSALRGSGPLPAAVHPA